MGEELLCDIPLELEGVQETGIEIERGGFFVQYGVRYRGLSCVAKVPSKLSCPQKLADASDGGGIDDANQLQIRHEHFGATEESCELFPRKRFNKEACALLMRLRHPNVVQFLGVHRPPNPPESSPGPSASLPAGQPGSGVPGSGNTSRLPCPYHYLPALIMEHLPFTLAYCLEEDKLVKLTHRGHIMHALPNPSNVTYSLLEDIALGVTYLHQNRPSPIVHGNLSAHNVLLNGNMTVAKISCAESVSVIKLLSGSGSSLQNLQQSASSSCSHLPPEALKARAEDVDGCKVDVYSYGVLMALLFRESRNNSSVEINPEDDTDTLVGADHPLKVLIGRCLHNAPSHRPKAIEVLMELRDVSSKFAVPTLTSDPVELLEAEVTSLKEDVEQLESTLQRKDAEIRTLRGELLQAKEKEIDLLMAEREAILSTMPQHLTIQPSCYKVPLDSSVSMSTTTTFTATKEPKKKKCYLCADLPVGMQLAHALVLDGRVYVGGGTCAEYKAGYHIWEYDPNGDTWSKLPPLPVMQFGIGEINGTLVAVGGMDFNEGCRTILSDKVYAFNRSAWFRKWREGAPPMPTARMNPTVFSQPSCLTAVGGAILLCDVEIFVVQTSQWHKASRAPIPLQNPSSAVICDEYFLSECNSNKILQLKVSVVFSSACQDSDRPKISAHGSKTLLKSAPHAQITVQWTEVPFRLMHEWSSLGSHKGVLVEVGGVDKVSSRPVKTVRSYSPVTGTWQKVTDLLEPAASNHTTVQLPSGDLLVVGGWDGHKCIRSVQMMQL